MTLQELQNFFEIFVRDSTTLNDLGLYEVEVALNTGPQPPEIDFTVTPYGKYRGIARISRSRKQLDAHAKCVANCFIHCILSVKSTSWAMTVCSYCRLFIAITVVSRKRAHGRSTLLVCQRGGWALFRLFPHLTTKEHPRHVYNDSKPLKQIIGRNLNNVQWTGADVA